MVPTLLVLTPHPRQRGLDLVLEAGDQIPVSGDEDLLGFDLGDDLLLGGEGWEGDRQLVERFQSEMPDGGS